MSNSQQIYDDIILYYKIVLRILNTFSNNIITKNILLYFLKIFQVNLTLPIVIKRYSKYILFLVVENNK